MNRRLAVLLSCIFIVACSDSGSQIEKTNDARLVRVKAKLPEQRDIQYVLTALGNVESIYDPTVSAETAGQVQRISVREGDGVTVGQQLVALDNTLHSIETSKAEAELRRAEVLLDNQGKEVKRLEKLSESQSVSRDNLEDEQAQQEILRAQRDVARKQWEQALYLQSKTEVISPIAGLVARRHVSPGDFVTSGQPLFDLLSIDRLRARIAFPEHDASQIALGKEVQLTTPAAPDVIAIGEVTAINPQIKMHNRAVEITVEFDNPGGWLPGASVDATLVVEERPRALTVPITALSNRGGKDVVFRVSNGVAATLPVELGWREEDWVELVSGVTEHDIIITEGAALISQGSAVEVSPEEQRATGAALEEEAL
ncbi:efflux RND transporter periplasmic adaptor subunit [Halioglobus maricola]|uniref:Efflux RND transporter periplasmic adaptor subunit n=1 Tax=Halioglobus maricola TaxID=2601894 RepID=A0A5P9NMY2_9GAMM|nr:efflux RND transporter periplasmic adaptor subunit [Halioglobus maricola]QFU77181.1 efflux RND transporter periplasmic adaptor subunit [Halioglobus maricola]